MGGVAHHLLEIHDRIEGTRRPDPGVDHPAPGRAGLRVDEGRLDARKGQQGRPHILMPFVSARDQSPHAINDLLSRHLVLGRRKHASAADVVPA